MKKILLLTACVMALGACSNITKLERAARKTSPNDFNGQLSREYLVLAKQNKREKDKKDANYFAHKGLKAAKGLLVSPDSPSQRNIPPAAQGDLNWGGQRLSNLLVSDLTTNFPKETASLQSTFDCWLEQTEDGSVSSSGRDCRMEYISKASELEHRLAPKPAPVATPVVADSFEEDLIVYFDLGRWNINGDAEAVFAQILELTKDSKEYYIQIKGHTDTLANEKFNKRLSQKRTEAVADGLVALGIDPHFIEEQYFGEDFVIRPTNDNVPEKINRRVEINVRGKR